MPTITRPEGEQIAFFSSRTGQHVLDTYLENAEKGGRTLSDLLGDIFDAAGAQRPYEFRDNAGVLEYRQPGASEWLTVTNIGLLVQAAVDAAGGISRTGDSMDGPLTVPAGAVGAQVPQAQEVVLLTGDQTVGGTKTFSNPIDASITGNAATATTAAACSGNSATATSAASCTGNSATVTNGVYTTGDQTVGGTKTFSSPVVATAGTKLAAANAWEYVQSGADLLFKYNGATKMKLDSSGNLTVSGNVTAYGAP